MNSKTRTEATWSAIKNAVRGDASRAKRSFADAEPTQLAIKSAVCAIGCIVGTAGVYQLVKGLHDPQKDGNGVETSHINGTRIFVGALTSFFGAAALYVASQASFKMHLNR